MYIELYIVSGVCVCVRVGVSRNRKALGFEETNNQKTETQLTSFFLYSLITFWFVVVAVVVVGCSC